MSVKTIGKPLWELMGQIIITNDNRIKSKTRILTTCKIGWSKSLVTTMSQEFWSSQRSAFLNSSNSRTPQVLSLSFHLIPTRRLDPSSTFLRWELPTRSPNLGPLETPCKPPLNPLYPPQVLGDPSQQTTTTWTGLRTPPGPDSSVPSRSGLQSSLQVSAERLLTEMRSRDRLPKEEIKNLQMELQRNGEEQQGLIRIVNELSHQITESDTHSKEQMKRY